MQEKERREALHSASPSLEGVEVSVARVAELAAFWWEAHIPSLTTPPPHLFCTLPCKVAASLWSWLMISQGPRLLVLRSCSRNPVLAALSLWQL